MLDALKLQNVRGPDLLQWSEDETNDEKEEEDDDEELGEVVKPTAWFRILSTILIFNTCCAVLSSS